MMKIREVSSTLVRADRETVFGALSKEFVAEGAVSLVPNERIDLRPIERLGSESYFILRDAPGGTRLVHGTSLLPRSLREGVFSKEVRLALQREVEDELASVKRAAEEAFALRR